jgi:hypothetical protein
MKSVEDLETVQLDFPAEDFAQLPESVQKNLSVNNAVFHHLHLVGWQVNKHSAVIWGDSTMRPAVCRVLSKYGMFDRSDTDPRPKYPHVVIKVKKSLTELFDLEPSECLIVVVNADDFAHEISKFCQDWDVLFRCTLMRVLLLSSVDVEVDLDKKTFIKDWVVQEPELSMTYFDCQIHKVKRFREQYQEALAEVERAKQLYEKAKEDLKNAIDTEDI